MAPLAEFNLNAGLWEIPAERMKMNRQARNVGTSAALPAHAQAHGMHPARENKWASNGSEVRTPRVDLLDRAVRGEESRRVRGNLEGRLALLGLEICGSRSDHDHTGVVRPLHFICGRFALC